MNCMIELDNVRMVNFLKRMKLSSDSMSLFAKLRNKQNKVKLNVISPFESRRIFRVFTLTDSSSITFTATYSPVGL
jgi:hypothetical protein